MELYLSKIIKFFIDPLHILFLIILIQLFIIFFIESKRLVIFFSKLFLVFLLFFSYTPLSNFILNKIEDYITPSKYPVGQLTGIIILGGGFDSGLIAKQRNEISLSGSAERLTKALEIYKKNPRILILFSGFSSEINPQGWSESDMAKKFFLEQGVKIDNLIFENQSRNTFENIKYSKSIITNYRGTWGIVTSAHHMLRSFFIFKKQGLILEPISVDYQTGSSKIFWISFDISSGISNWSIILHELIGIAYYKFTNKI